MKLYRPRLVIAALRGGAGKTVITLGLCAVLREKGLKVVSFKKGPDFIDPGWLSLVCGSECRNLDQFLMSEGELLHSFLTTATESDIALIEGNRGIFDGLDLAGTFSTASLAKLLQAPVLLIVDVTMATRTIAATIKGCQTFDPDLNMAGIILNRVAGKRQESLIRSCIDTFCEIPVVGAIPKLRSNPFPERHMGLVPCQEQEEVTKSVLWAKKIVEDYLDLPKILEIAEKNGNMDIDPDLVEHHELFPLEGASPKIGVIRDRAFWFYYPENLEQLKALGAEIVEINSLEDTQLPPVDALYIGGGFPETQAEHLSHNSSFRRSLKEQIEQGLPVYAECGGLMYLGRNLLIKDKLYPMVGALPLDFALEARPQGHGYTILEVVEENPYYPKGGIIKGHEFHYSRPLFLEPDPELAPVLKVLRGKGLDSSSDGLCKKNLFATYTHIHARGTPSWARGLVKVALLHKAAKISNENDFCQKKD